MIYTITSIAIEHRQWDDGYSWNKRCFGFFNNLDRAIKAVEDNECDLEEYYYDYIVIEEFDEGIHPRAKQELWYMWDEPLKRWMAGKASLCPCEKPKLFGSVATLVNFGIG